MTFLRFYLRARRKVILGFCLCCVIFTVSFSLYHLPVMAVLYPALLSLLLGVLLTAYDLVRAWRRHSMLARFTPEQPDQLPAPRTQEDADYQQIIRRLCREQARQKNAMELRCRDMVEYYTAWVHQIKTPISSIRLNLQNEDSAFSRTVAEELQRIEQYVQMVLVFLRLDSESTDYVLCSHELDEIVQSTVRKLSTQFIRRKIALDYEPLRTQVVTDEKWLSFVVEQVLSNALKYTPAGTISIYMEPDATLCIRDTGIGIAPEDLPRIFEKGYTGGIGRSSQRATGIGLYLCKRVCANLGHTISAESAPGAGTVIRIGLAQRKTKFE